MKPDFETTTQARYQSQRELGRGEDTCVELVFDRKRQLNLARKSWAHANAELRFRLRQQHRRSLSIAHANIAKVYDLSADNDETTLTMEFVPGTPAPEYLMRVSALGASKQQMLGGGVFLLRQLASALETLHKADIIHRAVKPSNWLVEDNGRAVLLDAGFAFSPEHTAASEQARHAWPYLAPECLRGALHSVESDWYSFGVLATELLTGVRPFPGSLESVLHAKDGPIESLRAACPGIPDDLDDLIQSLLSRDPRARPAPDEIAQLMGSLAPDYPFDPQGYETSPPSKPSHVQLKATATTTAQPSLAVTNVAESPVMIAQVNEPPRERSDAVSAESSVRHLSAALLDEPATLLIGEVADELAELVDDMLRTLPPSPVSNGQANAAGERVSGGEPLPSPPTQPAEPLDLGQQTPAAVALTALTAQLTSTPGPALWCVRGAHGAGKTTLMAALTQQLAEDASYLARGHGASTSALGALHELTGQLAEQLGDALPSTLQQIEPAQRSALVRLCPALDPSDRHIDLSAANTQQRLIDAHLGLRALIAQLCAHKPVLLFIDDAHSLDADTLAALRALLTAPVAAGQKVLLTIDSGALAADALSALLDASDAQRTIELDPPEVRSSRPPQGPTGSEPEAADTEGLVAAAQSASQTLALQRAADLLDRAVATTPSAPPELLQQAATAHAVAGRLRDAGRFWVSLARATIEPAQAQQHELEAAACFLRAGDESQALSIMRGVLRGVGLSWPRTPLLTSTVERARSLLRQSRPPTALRAAAHNTGGPQRFDALWSVAKELVLVAPDISDALAARALREAQGCGGRSRLLYALGYEASSAANIGGVFMQRRAASLNNQVRGLADASATAYDLAFASAVDAIVVWFQGDWSESERRLRVALQAFSSVESATSQERHVLGNFLLAALEAQGKLPALRAALAELRLSALQTGHRLALAFCELGSAGLLELAQDRPLEAIERADNALSSFGANTGFTPLHFQHFVCTTNARLYAGHHAQAYQQVEQAWSQLRRTHLAQLEGVAMMVHQLRARAALALASLSVDHESERLRAQALKLAHTLARSNLPHGMALRHVIEANAAALARHKSSAEAHCLRASELFDVAGMPLYREAARMARGAAGEGIDARLDATQSSALLEQAGIQDPARFTAAWFPVLREPLLEQFAQRA